MEEQFVDGVRQLADTAIGRVLELRDQGRPDRVALAEVEHLMGRDARDIAASFVASLNAGAGVELARGRAIDSRKALGLGHLVSQVEPEPGSWIARNLPSGAATAADAAALRDYHTVGDALREFDRQLERFGLDLDNVHYAVRSQFTRAREEALGGCTEARERDLAEQAFGMYERLVSDGDDPDTARGKTAAYLATVHTPGTRVEPDGHVREAQPGEPITVPESDALLDEQVDEAPAAGVGEADVNDAGWRWNPPPAPEVPERAPEPGSWIARNLGAAPQQFDRRADEDDDDGLAQHEAELRAEREANAAWSAQLDIEVAQHEAELRAEREANAAWVAQLDIEQVREVVQQAEEIDRHLAGCNLDVGQCATCSAQEHDDGSLRDLAAAARTRLVGMNTGRVDTLGAEDTHQQTDDHRGERDTGHGTDDVLDRIDEVLADEPDPPPLRATVEDCGRAVAQAEQAVQQAEVEQEDSCRAERCARWNSDDRVCAATDVTSDEWGSR
ncbi:hypothetical protein [Amycolatopsis ultiminotia]|uniref:hypothetical protein n=1 Tax=Amycolatopsis ultiminotia TaxID=543629 RepID=UPI0031E56065